jgi:hypothetical protein
VVDEVAMGLVFSSSVSLANSLSFKCSILTYHPRAVKIDQLVTDIPRGLSLTPNHEINNSENYWVFGLSPSSGILGNRKHYVSETGSVSVLVCGRGENTYSVGSFRHS